jgi:hypothetical protein
MIRILRGVGVGVGRLFLSRPVNTALFIDHVAEPVPIEFPMAERAAEFNLAVGNGHDLPVSFAGTVLDIDLLAHPKRIRLENGYVMGLHFDPPMGAV